MIDAISFTAVRKPYGWLGNMSPHPVLATGEMWRTTEALFQSMRFETKSEPWRVIHAERSPMGAKMMAKKFSNQMIVVPRSDADLLNMKVVLHIKMSQHAILRQLLVETGEVLIVEDVSNRPTDSGLFWGAARDGDDWRGQNRLGNLWMEVRRDIRWIDAEILSTKDGH